MNNAVEIIKNEIVEFNEFDAQLAEFKSKYEGVVYDLTIPEDEKQARSDRLTIGKVISKLDTKHKELKAPLKAQTDLIDGERKRIKDDLLSVQDNIKLQIKQHDDAIREHDEMLQDKVEHIIGLGLFDEGIEYDSDYLSIRLGEANKIDVDDSYEHRKADATLAQVETVKKLKALLDARVKYEKEQAELEKLRKEAEARAQKDREDAIRKEAEESAKKEAEAKAMKAKLDDQRKHDDEIKAKEDAAAQAIEEANKREQAAKDEAERLAKESLQKANKAVEDERNRIHKEQMEKNQKESEQAAKIEAKKSKQAYRKKIHTSVKKDLIAGGIDEADAVLVVELLRDGKIKNALINY